MYSKYFILAAVLLYAGIIDAQSWKRYINTPSPNTRMDDIYFFNRDSGVVLVGNFISRTVNGGQDWDTVLKLQDTAYFRSLEFNGQTGYAGTLNGTMFQSKDAGRTWNNITSLMPQSVKGFCGIAMPYEHIIYSCGVYSGTPFIMKSTDGGNNWTYTALDSLCSGLVEVYFIDSLRGFASGRALNKTNGTILHTSDGGKTWKNIFVSSVLADHYVWKISTPDNKYFFASIESDQKTDPRLVVSEDSGRTWTERHCTLYDFSTNDDVRFQMIGFLTPLHGFMCGQVGTIFETKDGGKNWYCDPYTGISSNRFFMIDKDHAVICGLSVWFYSSERMDQQRIRLQHPPEMPVKVYPNPARGNTVTVEFYSPLYSICEILLHKSNGACISTLYNDYAQKGDNKIQVNIDGVPDGEYIISVQTNIGMFSVPVQVMR